MFRLLLVLAVMIPGAAAALFSRFSGLLLYQWFSFFRPQEWVWFDIRALRFSLISLVLFVVPSFLTGVLPDIKNPISRAMGFLIISGIIAELTTPAPRESWDWLQLMVQTGIVNLLLVTVTDTPAKLRALVLVVTASIGYHSSVQGFAALTSPGFQIAEGIGGSFGDNNSYAVGCAMIAALFFTLGRELHHRWARAAATVAGGLSLLTVVATSSRGGFLAAAAAMLVMGLLRRLNIKWLAGAAIAVGLFMTFMPAPEGYTDRLKSIQTYEQDESAAGRLHFWNVAVTMVGHHPLGVGVQNFNSVYDRYDSLNGAFGSSRSVHSSHFQVLSEAGLIGFTAYVFLLLYGLMAGLRIRRRVRGWEGSDARFYSYLAEGLISAWVAYIVGGMFTAIGWNDFVWCVFALMAALDQITRAEEHSRHAESGDGYSSHTLGLPDMSARTLGHPGSIVDGRAAFEANPG